MPPAHRLSICRAPTSPGLRRRIVDKPRAIFFIRRDLFPRGSIDETGGGRVRDLRGNFSEFFQCDFYSSVAIGDRAEGVAAEVLGSHHVKRSWTRIRAGHSEKESDQNQ